MEAIALNQGFKHKKQRVYALCIHPLFFMFLFFQCQGVAAQYFEFNETLQKAYGNILCLHYDKSQAFINAQLKVTPKHAIALYLKNFNEILPVFILEDKQSYQRIASHEDEVLRALEKLPPTSPYFYFTQAEVKLHWALLKLKFGDNASAALNVRACYKLLETGLKKYPDFVPMLKTMAVLKIVIGSIPESYTWITSVAGLYGDLNKGIQQLSSIAHGNTIYNREAKLWLLLCEHYLLGNNVHSNLIAELRKQDPHNILYLFIDVSLKVHDAHSEEALIYYQNKTVNSEAYQLIPSFYYMLGEVNLHKGLYQESIAAFNLYIQAYKGQAYIKDTYYKIFIAYWLLGNEPQAKKHKSLVLTKGVARNDSDKQALKMVKAAHFPAKDIYKIRLMTDGGYLTEAIALVNKLNQQQFNNASDRIEFQYRKARLFHKSGDVEQAILYYVQTIKENPNSKEYFIPNSCLQLGYIYRDLKQEAKATFYFKKVFEYHNYEYKQTIESKAKAGLSSLEK